MELNELKKSMSTLDQILAKTDSEIKIDKSYSETAKSKILKKFRQAFTSCLVLATAFMVMAVANYNPEAFPNYLKVGMSCCLVIGGIWYIFLYRTLNKINLAALAPAQFFSKTTRLKLMVISGEVFFLVCLTVFFVLLFQSAWTHSKTGFWAMAATLIFAIVAGLLHYWPQYIMLFRQLNSINE